MPPKKSDGASKKTNEKIKAKIIEDKTFGLKNKKGAKQQKFIQQVQKQVSNKDQQKNPRDLDPNAERQKKLEEEKKKKEELQSLFKPVLQTVPKGVDPKSVVCVYFKQGICQKGDRCKFSHDLSIERKAEKRNIYEDTRDQKDENMENWSEDQLNDVVNQKHGDDNKKKNTTQIVCKYFIEAVENKTYGWFWNCPNGNSCMYRHALPPGFTLKSEMKKQDKEDEVSLEMLIEKERASLGSNVTKVTLESFLAWKIRKVNEKKEENLKQEAKKRSDFKLGFHSGLTGRDLFTFDPSMIGNEDDDGVDDGFDYKQRANDDDGSTNAYEIKADSFAAMSKESDNTGTIATADRFAYMDSYMNSKLTRDADQEGAGAAAAVCSSNGVASASANDNDDEDEDNEQNIEEEFKKSMKNLEKKTENLQIDESLFNLEDLPDLDEELEKLES